MSEKPVCVTLSTPIKRSPRVQQVEGLFDLKACDHSTVKIEIALPLEERSWNVGLIVGPSGSGKSTLARHLWPERVNPLALREEGWPKDASVLDAFPAGMPIKEVTTILSSVGFSSPPAWLRPYHCLSTGERFRVGIARLLAEADDTTVVDEYTSVVDRTVAQVGSHAISKTVRNRGQRFVAVTCHEDVIAWLNPDWVCRPAEQSFAWRFLQRRPAVQLQVARVYPEAWTLFRPHHYLSHTLHKASTCVVAFWGERPVAFSSWLPYVGTGPPTYREHRTVTLPDYQGIGIGHALSTFMASCWKTLGYRATSTTTHPAFIASRRRDRNWRMNRAPGLFGSAHDVFKHAITRMTAGFEYVGPHADVKVAKQLLT